MLKREENSDINQTEFVNQAAFLEEEEHLRPSLEEIKKNRNLVPFYILAGIIVFLLLVFILVSVLRNRGGSEDLIQLPEKTYEELDPLTQRVKSLEADLEEADPTRQSLPFPQVDLEFNID